MTDLLKRNFDLAATISTGAALLALDTTIGLPWPIWAAYGTIAVVQIGNRIIGGWSR